MVKTNVLGTDYTVELMDLNDRMMAECDGRCNSYSKRILLRETQYMMMGDASEKEQKIRFGETLVHELIHAYCAESGVQWDNDEVLVDWFAIMIPKIVKSYNDVLKKLDEEGTVNENQN